MHPLIAASPAHPHVNERNIPDVNERIRLLELIQQHEQTLDGVESRLAEAIGRRDTFRILYEEQQKMLEETSVSLQDAKEIVQKLLNRSLRAQDDMKMLQLPMHPIRRCPSDVLQCIFEWTIVSVFDYDMKHKYATALSHVCYKWREIAIRTPTLWSCILVSLMASPEAINAFWSRTLERIKMRPASIYIEDIDAGEKACAGMKKCRLDLVPFIEDLTFLVDDNEGAECFLKSNIDLPLSGITKFSIGCNTTPVDTLVFDPRIIFTSFPNLHSLNLSNFDFSSFTANASFDKITDLSISQSESIPLWLLAQAFLKAREVKFYDANFLEERTDEIIWPEVVTFFASSTQNLPWTRLKFPLLNHLILPDRLSDPGFEEFIFSHTSLLHLELRHSKGYFPAIVKGAPQLISLTVAVENGIVPLSFPTLLCLTLYQTTSKSFPGKLFENIVRKLFQPIEGTVGNPETRDLASLTILVPIKKQISLQWQRVLPIETLPLVVEESVEERWNTTYRSYCFRWRP